jgi:hypothetical protein
LKLKWRVKYRRQRNTWTADWGSEFRGSSERDTLASVLLASCCCCHDCPTTVGTFSSHTALSALPTSKLAAAAPPPPPPPPPSFSPLPAISSAPFGVFTLFCGAYLQFAGNGTTSSRTMFLKPREKKKMTRTWITNRHEGEGARAREPRERASERARNPNPNVFQPLQTVKRNFDTNKGRFRWGCNEIEQSYWTRAINWTHGL